MAEKVKVKSGQTLSSIAKANNTTVSALLDANPKLTEQAKYNDGKTLFSGTTITIPDAPTSRNVPLGVTDSQNQARIAAEAAGTPTGSPFTTPASEGGQFTGPIPVGATRTETGYTTADGEEVTPTSPYTYDPVSKTFKPNFPASKTGKKEVSRVKNPDGTFTVTYDDGTTEIVGTPTGKTVTRTEILGSGASRVIRTYYSDGTFIDTPAPDTTPQGMSAEDVQKLLMQPLQNQWLVFRHNLLLNRKLPSKQSLSS